MDARWSLHEDLNPAQLLTREPLYQISYGGMSVIHSDAGSLWAM